jgi:hydroxymethylglutaryl-CoA lyase
MNELPREVELVEVSPRDGFQSVAPIIPTQLKIDLVRALHTAGLRRIEVTSFVSHAAVPQLADAAQVLAATTELEGLDAQVLVPTAVQAERALAAGARHLAFVLSVSEWHNRSNVKRSPAESVQEYARLVASVPQGTRLRLNVATAFDCPSTGEVPAHATLALLSELVATAPDAEIALCDTTGRATPRIVGELFRMAADRFPEARGWAFHGHDTYGMGAANALAAVREGVRAIDASCSGLGGCPFAPGASGNVASEDIVWMLRGMGIDTGVNLESLVAVAERMHLLPGALTGGRVRQAIASRVGRGREAA